ncbi:MAG: arginine deiminase, partial [Gammaproteobacteria bacterium]|nr:arginine deiminase [Gammaproteobacteria bacterium]
MHWPARQRETLNLAVIYKFHPLFKKASFETWYDGSDMEAHLPTVEGGDVLVLSKDCIAIGVSERSTPEAIETLAKRLFAKEDKQQIIAIEIPKERASMHLDTVMTMLDDHSFCIAFPCETIRAWNLRPNDDGSLNVRKEKNVFNAIGKAIGREKLRLITLGGDDFTEKREQWSDASNLLAISPGVVIGYERNVYTNKKLFNEGFDVISIPGSELGRGRGGARCMSCPIEREPFLF